MHGASARKGLLWVVTTCLFASSAQAGGGNINDDGTANLNINFTFPPTPLEVQTLIAELQVASRTLCDASNGVIRIKHVNLTAGDAQQKTHDVEVNFVEPRSNSSLLGLGPKGQGDDTTVVNLYPGGMNSATMAHELGHYLFAAGDEYPEDSRGKTSCGIGIGIDGTTSEVLDTAANTVGHTIMSSYSRGRCGLIAPAVPGGIDYSSAGSSCNIDSRITPADIGIAGSTAISACPFPQVCFPSTSSELTTQLNHDRVHGLSDNSPCPVGIATTKLEISGQLNGTATNPAFDSSSFAAANATSAHHVEFKLVDAAINKHTGTLYFVRRAAAGANKWTVHITVPRAEVTGCTTPGTGDLCIVNTIDFTSAPAVDGCGDFSIGTGEQCDVGPPPSGDVAIDVCSTKFPFNFGYVTCNNACGFNYSQCFLPAAFTCGFSLGIQAPEECDGVELNSKTCQDLGFGPGTLKCAPNCTFDTTGCAPRTAYVPPTVTIDGGRTVPFNVTFNYTGAPITVSVTRFQPEIGTTFSIYTGTLTGSSGADNGFGKTSCAKDTNLQYCVDGFNSTTNRFETSDHSHRYRKDCSGHWVTEKPCTTTADCADQHAGATCETITAPCEEPKGGGVLAPSSCKRCREPSPLASPVRCTECATNSKAMCGVPENEVLTRVFQDLKTVSSRTFTFPNPPPDAPDPVAMAGGWDEPKDHCFTQVGISNNISFADQVYIVIDMSGSMTEPTMPGSIETKLNYAKAALRNYVTLRQNDVLPLGISYFDHDVNPAIPSATGMKQIPIGKANDGTPSVAAQILAVNDAMITRNGNTAIGNALIAAVDAFRVAGNAASRRIYILTDGISNTGPEPDSQLVKDALATLDIHVDIAPIGTNVAPDKLAIIAALSNGSVRYAPQGDYVPDVFADFGMTEKSDTQVLPETESLVYNVAAFNSSNCTRESCISPLIRAPLSETENHAINVETGAQKLEVLLVSRQPFSATWAPDFQLVSPNGTQVITPASSAFVTHDNGASTCIEVSSCRYWSRITVPNPAAGTWHLLMATTAPFQASFVSARVRHADVQCLVDVEDDYLPDGKPAKIVVRARSRYQTLDARTYNVTGVVTGPNGVAVPLTFEVGRWASDHAKATFKGFVGRGSYDVSVQCNVPKTAQLVPAEPTSPVNSSVAVDPFVRFASQRFFYDSATMPPGIRADDCDFDLIPDSVEGSLNTDGDAWPDKCDSDSDNDGLSDSVEGVTDTDGDGLPEYRDADCDNDTVKDERDNCRKQANASQSDIDSDRAGDVCDSDMDGDGRINTLDNCPTVPNPDQADSNGNSIGNACEGISGCTPVITAANQSITRCVGDVAPAAVTASATCSGSALPLFGRVISVNGQPITNGTAFAANTRPELPVGTIVIRWTATGPGLITVTRDQTVTIAQADTAAACCPAGSTVVNGTNLGQILLYPLFFNYCVLAKGGNDLVTGGFGPDVFSGGDGDDDLLGVSGFDTLIGGAGTDELTLALAGSAYGGAGDDALTAIFGPATMYGGDGNDSIAGSPFNDDITPGAGADVVLAGAGNDIVRINAPCEAATFEVLDGSFGFDTLYTPVPLTTLQALGLIVVGFERIVVTGTSDYYKSSCGLVPCTPAPCAPLPLCGSQLWSTCPGQLINCPCSAPNVCRDGFNLPAAPGAVGTCKP